MSSSSKITTFFQSKRPENSTPPIEAVETEDSQEAEEIINLGNESEPIQVPDKRKRNYRIEWHTEFPWLAKVSQNQAKCLVCERNKIDLKTIGQVENLFQNGAKVRCSNMLKVASTKKIC